MPANPIQYTSRTFQTVLNDINSDPDLRDKPEWWKRIWAGVADVLGTYLNAQANNTYLRTAFTRQAVIDLCELIDYRLAPQSTSNGILYFDMDAGEPLPVSFARTELVAQTTGTLTQSARRFEARTGETVSAFETGTFTAAAAILTVAKDFIGFEKVRVSTTGTLPAGLDAGTDYYVVRVSATEISLALSRADARAGVVVSTTDAGTGVHSWIQLSLEKTVYQQRSVEEYVAGRAQAGVEWQEIELADARILRDTLTVTINGIAWLVLGKDTTADSFVFSEPTDRHVKLLYDTDGGGRLLFGNGTYGEIPGSFDVFVSYAVGGGAGSNVAEGRVTTYAGGADEVQAVYNPLMMTGGADEQSMDDAKRIAPLLLKARDRFVTVEDGKVLSENYPGISLAKVNPNVFGVLSAQVLTIANGGGNPSSTTQGELEQFLIDRTVLESMDIRVEDSVIVPVNVTCDVAVLPGFTFGDVQIFVELAIQMFWSETGTEIKSRYVAEGTPGATELINDLFGAGFGAGDFAQIEALVQALEPVDYGVTIQESSAIAYIDSFVFGVDYLVMTAPAFPVVLADDEITTVGVVTVNEI